MPQSRGFLCNLLKFRGDASRFALEGAASHSQS
ncbi:hypothetical protein FAGKG844_330001 [Frankia sp. AgKG'84/4]